MRLALINRQYLANKKIKTAKRGSTCRASEPPEGEETGDAGHTQSNRRSRLGGASADIPPGAEGVMSTRGPRRGGTPGALSKKRGRGGLC